MVSWEEVKAYEVKAYENRYFTILGCSCIQKNE